MFSEIFRKDLEVLPRFPAILPGLPTPRKYFPKLQSLVRADWQRAHVDVYVVSTQKNQTLEPRNQG